MNAPMIALTIGALLLALGLSSSSRKGERRKRDDVGDGSDGGPSYGGDGGGADCGGGDGGGGCD